MRHVFVTAGSKGLGRKVTEAFLAAGDCVTVTYRNDRQSYLNLCEAHSDTCDRLFAVQGDLTKSEDIQRMMQQATSTFGSVEVLVNNAGPYIFERKKLYDYTPGEWEAMVSGNLSAMFYLLQEVLPEMRRQKYGRIVSYGFQEAANAPGWLYRSAFAAAKSGLASLTKTVALEEAEHGITMNMVCPGEITSEFKESTVAEVKQIEAPEVPVGRPGSGGDIARAVAFLCDSSSDFITGSVLEVTGGADVLHKRRN
ncbi:3-oxoacyl-[acyl-carrier protein] reductase [Salsuginibacillus halophilus]|uniref:3-oxoacyl-[acyl-carrier protein] reductase n=1 Tax=Salsuginibacillus halophilus TaxID=517424 RepID=A0A2P8HED7_9BACI|nr:SDR family oxidoreductase [Salsuginibacillus halophilus]PSL44573.1 3-oxoacyl-[acyl-carrier protein] reductase [Salsuginibacillus halophilus]